VGVDIGAWGGQVGRMLRVSVLNTESYLMKDVAPSHQTGKEVMGHASGDHRQRQWH
jgi:hypothetical protein